MEIVEIEWIEPNNHLLKGVVNSFDLFYIYKTNAEEFKLEVCLPLKKNMYELDTENKCKAYADKILKSFVHSLIRR